MSNRSCLRIIREDLCRKQLQTSSVEKVTRTPSLGSRCKHLTEEAVIPLAERHEKYL